MTVMNPVVVQLKDIGRGDVLVFKQVIELQVGAEGGPLGVEGDGPAVGNVDAARCCLLSVDINE